LLRDPDALTYYPDHKRKSKWRIAGDLFRWFLKYKEVNRYYYFYGLDRHEAERSNEVMGLRRFRFMRDRPNQQGKGSNFNYVALLRDKFIFGQYLASLGFPTPRNIALLDRDSMTWLDTMDTVPLSSLTAAHVNLDGFCKKLTGMKGEGSFPLKVEQGRLYVRGKEITVDELMQKIDETYLFQERIVQHPDMSRLHPSSVNTIRMITVNNNNKVEVLCATQRIGTHGHSVDNFASGGLIAGIDLETGKLRKDGLFKPGLGRRVETHPDTGIVLDGYTIPFFEESKKITTDLHRFLYGIHSIGWDIALTETGPILIEGNDDWDGTLAMSLEKDFIKQFVSLNY
jgi:hypothetical protein